MRHIKVRMADEPAFFKDRMAWRRWLSKNHDKSTEIWILTFKKHTGVKCLSYEEALEEAICYGWIDSRLRRIDDERHTWRFAPRRLDSIWSLSNRRRAERLIEGGRMTAHGMATVEAAKRSGMWDKACMPSKPPRIPKDLRDALKKDEAARRNFQAFAKSYRHTYTHWILSAKREETRGRRVEEVVRRAGQNLRPGES